ncbi:MAG: FGGY-family carbohydrate kinase [Tannerellaceae bacterium]|nr:FGGY-family carbohydrate kinase [Tannerellaceae bacterium]
MDNKVIAYDLGTGGLKASLFRESGEIMDSAFVPYSTSFPQANYQEQAPEDWWNAIVTATRQLLEKHPAERINIQALAISGHSLGVVPMSKKGELLRATTPIWSDMRATAEAETFFRKVDYEQWYNQTGNGFPAACYTVFKIMWYRENEPDMFRKIHKVIGTKDYCNFRFSGRLCTDFSYASGSGVYNLQAWKYNEELMYAAGLNPSVFPEILPSDAIIGTITSQAAAETGLPEHVRIICGGVDNSCMALGAKRIIDGRIYTSLGSSAWVALVASQPVLDFKYKPYVFAHVIKGMYTSATCIFSAGTSQKWVRDICDIPSWDIVNRLIEETPPGSNGILFNPSLAGGSMMEPSPFMTGAFTGLKLSNSRADLLRATQEGIALNLWIALDLLKKAHPDIHEMLIVGGGAKSPVWMQIFADIYKLKINKTTIDQEAASLGVAALALKGTGIWKDYLPIDSLHRVEREYVPEPLNSELYDTILEHFKRLTQYIATTC